MEEIKFFVLDFIFSSLESFGLLILSFCSLSFLKIKQTCYQIPALDYIGLIILLFLIFLILKLLKKRTFKTLSSLWIYSCRSFRFLKKKKYKIFQTDFVCQSGDFQVGLNIQKHHVMRDVKKMIIKSNQDILIVKNALNSEELLVFKALKDITKDLLIDIFPQVPLRAFFKTSKESLSHFIVGGMYVDFLLVDAEKKSPRCVVEYFGEGHYGESEYKKEQVSCNDEIKKEVFEKAGIGFFVIRKSDLDNNQSKVMFDIRDFLQHLE